MAGGVVMLYAWNTTETSRPWSRRLQARNGLETWTEDKRTNCPHPSLLVRWQQSSLLYDVRLRKILSTLTYAGSFSGMFIPSKDSSFYGLLLSSRHF